MILLTGKAYQLEILYAKKILVYERTINTVNQIFFSNQNLRYVSHISK